jgi:PAS domain S-box-containing protein
MSRTLKKINYLLIITLGTFFILLGIFGYAKVKQNFKTQTAKKFTDLSSGILANIDFDGDLPCKNFHNKIIKSYNRNEDFAFVYFYDGEGKLNENLLHSRLSKPQDNIADVKSYSENFFQFVSPKFESNSYDLGYIVVGYDVSGTYNTLIKIIIYAEAFLFLLLGLILLFVNFIVKKYINDPLAKLTEKSKEIANGDLTSKIKLEPKSDYFEVSENINLMASNLLTNLNKIKKNRESIKQLEFRSNEVVENSPNGIVLLDSQKNIIKFNNSFKELFSPDLVLIASTKIYDAVDLFKKFDKEINDVIRNRTHVTLPKEHLGSDEEEICLNIIIYPITHQASNGAAILVQDITEQISLEKQLIQSQKMEAIGTLAGGLAHDFNNVLGGIIGALSIVELKLKHMDDDNLEAVADYLKTIEDSADRAKDMVQQLLTLSRRTELEIAPVDLNIAVRHVVKICKTTFDKAIKITPYYHQEKPIIEADPTHIEQILLNICVNANHAMTIMRPDHEIKSGTLNIVVHKIISDSLFLEQHPEASQIEYWCIEITDTGVGMDQRTISKIFEPFFTTKDKHIGTGLGLSMVYNIIRQHNGFLDVKSEVGKGSTFNIYLPVANKLLKPEQVHNKTELPKGNGTILLIDDENAIRLTTEAALVLSGYKVICAEDGHQGLELFAENKDNIKCVVLDMIMPNLSGKETYLKLKKIDPNVKVILTSGFKQDERVNEIMELGVQKFISKPYSLQTVSTTVHEVLNES